MARKRGVVATLMGARRRAGVGLAVGAVLVWAGGTAWGLPWVPLLAGLGALFGAYGAGAKDGPWGAGCVLTGYGLAHLAVAEAWVDEPAIDVVVAGLALGLVACAALVRRGVTISSTGVAGAAAAIALGRWFAGDVSWLREPSFWAVVVAAWAVVHLLELRR